MNTAKLLLVILFSIAVVACGGGGGSGGSGGSSGGNTVVASTLSFPLLSGFQTLIANGYTKSGVVTGTCSGTATMTVAPASTATTFEGQPALSSAETWNRTYSNCTPASNTLTGTYYYNSGNYLPLGGINISSISSIGGGLNYGVYQATPTIPASVHVGDSGDIGVILLWTDSTKTTAAGRILVYYSITADTASTAIVWLYGSRLNTAGGASFLVIERYRMDSTGALTPISKYGYDHTTGQNETVTIN